VARWLCAAPLLVSLLGLLPASLGAQEHGPARAGLERFSAGLETLHASFEQTITGPDGRVEDDGVGEVWLARPNRLRWEYHGEFPETIVADGQRVWMHDVLLEQVTVKPQSGFADDSPLALLTDLSALDARFEVREVGDYEGMHLLELVTRGLESEFERVLLGLAGDELRLMVMEDAFGLRTEIRFANLRRNPELAEGLFDFVPPAGADVVGEVTTEP
jgi:outer membrane lipoprotein carrier protein